MSCNAIYPPQRRCCPPRLRCNLPRHPTVESVFDTGAAKNRPLYRTLEVPDSGRTVTTSASVVYKAKGERDTNTTAAVMTIDKKHGNDSDDTKEKETAHGNLQSQENCTR